MTSEQVQEALPEASWSERERMRYLAPAVISSLITLIALAPVGYVLWRNFPPPIATVDLQKLVEEDQQEIMELFSKDGDITDDQRAKAEKRTVDFAKQLSTVIDRLGAECRCVIVNKAALLGGVTIDYTDLVREQIKR